MARLDIHLLGLFKASLDGETLSGFDSDKVRALLAYLAVDADFPHRREKLAGLFWSEWPERSARTNLRSALANLRHVIGDHQAEPPFLLISRQSIQFNRDSNYSLDVNEFTALVEGDGGKPPNIEQLDKAIRLYYGNFLEGFSIPDSIPFEEWVVVNREGLQMKATRALHLLAEHFENQAIYDLALDHARRQVVIDSYSEDAHRQAMRILARSGQRNEALEQYEACRKILKEELDVEPQEETIQLYQTIKDNLALPELEGAHEESLDFQGNILNNRYHLSAELGRGSLGAVYTAYDSQDDREVAVKVIPAAKLRNQQRLEWVQESRNTLSLNHPNIARVLEVGEAEGTLFIVTDLIKGKSLAEMLRSHDEQIVSFEAILAIARQACAALEHAHARGIIHRDLKPENMLVKPDGLLVLVGFGLTRSIVVRLTSEVALMSSIYYLSPELALGQPHDGRADLYALGAILYELTTGQTPFSGDNPVAVISQHLHASVVPARARNANIPPALDALILRLLDKNPDGRPESVSEVLKILDSTEILDQEATPIEEISVLKRIDRGRLVGRKKEMEEASLLWDRMLSGQGKVLVISGEAGVGKTRLVREIITRSEVFGGRALVGTCYSEASIPYAPFRQIIRAVFRSESLVSAGIEPRLPEAVLADLFTLAPELSSRYPDIPANPTQDPQIEQQRLFENLAIFLTTICHLAPLLVVLEDVQWADNGSLLMLQHLARHAHQERIMIAITCRDVDPSEAPFLYELLHDFRRERLSSQLKLPRLASQETEELLSILFAEDITPEFLDGIYYQTEGNPFFIEEVCKALVESGKVYYADGRWHRPVVMDELEIPTSVKVAIQSRVRVLPEDSQQTLNLAAVLGREFDFSTLAKASDLDEGSLIETLEDAQRAQLIEEIDDVPDGRYTFVHTLIPTTLVESLRSLQRRRLHRLAAIAIEAQRPDDFEALAHHYSRAGEAEKASEYLLQAGDRARRLYAHKDAIGHYISALDFLKRTGDLERAARTYMKLGLTYHNAFDFKEARQAYQEGFIFWQRMADEKRRAPDFPLSAPHSLRVTGVEPKTLGLGQLMDFPSRIVLDQLFSGLVEVSSEMGVVPDVARSWEVLDGGRKYVFHLRSDVYWSDGIQMTAQDFEYSWKRILDPAGTQRWHVYLFDIKNAMNFHQGKITDPDMVGVRALDDFTLAVELEDPTSYFPYLLAFIAAYPMPRHVVEVHGDVWANSENIVTNGPYRLVSWNKGETLVLERNPTYHGRITGNVQRVEYVFLSGKHTRFMENYKANKLDIYDWLPIEEFASTRQLFAEDYVSGPCVSTNFFGFDVTRLPFNDQRVRRALAMATDRETLADVILRGYVFPATGGFVPPEIPGHSPGIGLPFDPETARRLLAEAGYPGGHGFPVIECLARDDPGHDIACEYLKTQWLEILGVEINWKQIRWVGFFDLMAENPPPMWMVSWFADYPDPDNILRVPWWLRFGGWENQAYTELVEGARSVMNQAERLRMYQKSDKILVEEAALLPLWYGRFHMLVKPWIKKLFTSPIKWWSWKDIFIEPHS